MKSASRHLERAREGLARGNFGEAAGELVLAVQSSPDHVEAWSLLGQVRLRLGEMPAAEVAAARLVRLVPNAFDGHYLLGLVRYANDDLDAAATHLERAVALQPDLADAHGKLGRIRERRGALADAEVCYRRAAELDRSEPSYVFNLGVALRSQERIAEAEACYREAIRRNNDFWPAHNNLALLVSHEGNKEEAARHFREVLRVNPQHSQARYLLAALTATQAPDTAPTDYIIGIFDGVADRFDDILVGELNYRIPEKANDLVREFLAPESGKVDVLDIGCGTGLCGILLRDISGRLDGVDLSPRMIEKARARGIYDALHEADVTSHVASLHAQYDLIVALDLFVYVGALDRLFAASGRALRAGGRFVFSIESAPDDKSFFLHGHGRYAHSTAYIRALAGKHGFLELAFRPTIIRREHDDDVQGNLVLLARPERI